MLVELTILPEDFIGTNYYDTDDCPITRSLHRAGYTHLEDVGFSIQNKESKIRVHEWSNEEGDEEPHCQIHAMYKYLKTEGKEGIKPDVITFTVDIY